MEAGTCSGSKLLVAAVTGRAGIGGEHERCWIKQWLEQITKQFSVPNAQKAGIHSSSAVTAPFARQHQFGRILAEL
jgi:hypothetical protein